MEENFWLIFAAVTAYKVLLTPANHSTDFEVHRNWLAITHSLPLKRWYYDATSEWTLDYPPFFAYFEWALSQVAKYVDPKMLSVHNFNYASEATKYFQRLSVVVMDIVFVLGVIRCFRALNISKLRPYHRFIASLLLLGNIGLIFVDHIHFQYNGFLFGLLLLSIGLLFEEHYLLSALIFAILLNFKHIFLYIAPAYAVYFLKFYCTSQGRPLFPQMLKLAAAGIAPFLLSLGPFWDQLPQLIRRLFPFKRGLTHAYWAPNFWALYNAADIGAAKLLRLSSATRSTSTSGLVQEVEHIVLPKVTPLVTFVLTAIFMMPILIKLMFFTAKKNSNMVFMRAVVLCSCASFMFGWHVHEKAILMCLIPICFLYIINPVDAKYAFLLSAVGYFSLFPLLFHTDLILIRYSLYLSYMCYMYASYERLHKVPVPLNVLEKVYIFGFLALPVYEHIISPLMDLDVKLPFMPLLLTSLYCSLGVSYFFVRYYIYTLELTFTSKPQLQIKAKSKSKKKKKLQ